MRKTLAAIFSMALIIGAFGAAQVAPVAATNATWDEAEMSNTFCPDVYSTSGLELIDAYPVPDQAGTICAGWGDSSVIGYDPDTGDYDGNVGMYWDVWNGANVADYVRIVRDLHPTKSTYTRVCLYSGTDYTDFLRSIGPITDGPGTKTAGQWGLGTDANKLESVVWKSSTDGAGTCSNLKTWALAQ